MNDVAQRLAEQGVAVPELRPVPGLPAVGFPSSGAEAVDWWHRLRAVSDRTGHWPLLIESPPSIADTDSDGADGSVPRLAQAEALDPIEVLNPGGSTLESVDEAQYQEWLDDWPDEPYRVDGFSLPFTRTGEPDPTLVALVAAEHGWQIPVLIGYGDWNQCPAPAVHGAVLRHWQQRYGAELVSLSHASLELALTRPPRTRPEALALAWEYASYCTDSVDAIFQADSLAELAAAFLDAPVLPAWWD